LSINGQRRLFRWKDITFYKKLLLLYSLLVILLVACFYAASYITSRETLDLKTKDYMNHIGDLISLKIWRSIDEMDSTIQSAVFDMYLKQLLENYNEQNKEDRQTALSYISGKVHQLVSLNTYVEAVDFYFFNGDQWISPASKAIPDVFKSPYFYINNLNQKLEWVELEKSKNTINGSKILMDSKHRAIALVVVKVNRNFLTDVLSEDNLTSSMNYYLSNQKGIIFSSSNFDILGSERKGTDTNAFIQTEREVTVLHWNLLLQSPKVTFTSYILDYGKSQIVLILIILLLGFLTSLAMALSISNPVKRLTRQMRSVAESDLTLAEVPMMHNEILFLEKSFNRMMRRIDELINNVYKETIFRRESELKALQAQINPHFLFNVLDLLNWKALMAGQDEISEVVQSLSRLMEANMNMDEKTVTLTQELAYIRDYFNIMSKKFGDQIVLIEEVDAQAANYRIPKLLLQPLVENAIQHGFEYIEYGQIRIVALKSGEMLRIRIEDTGRGMSMERLQEVQQMIKGCQKNPFWKASDPSEGRLSDSIGLVNIYKRIQVIYEEDCSFIIESTEANGTSVELNLPFKPQEERNV
jgi:sensor histidine kinase YesM